MIYLTLHRNMQYLKRKDMARVNICSMKLKRTRLETRKESMKIISEKKRELDFFSTIKVGRPALVSYDL